MIVELLQQRRSVRQFADREVPSEVIDDILEAGRLSASGGNEQPWYFGVITERERILSLSELAYNQQWIGSAALIVALCTTIVPAQAGGRNVHAARFPAYAAAIRDMDEGLYARLLLEEHQTKIPGTQMVLAALEYGVGSTWVSYFDVDKVSQYLNLPPNCLASELLAFGYPAATGKMRPKKELSEIVFDNRYR